MYILGISAFYHDAAAALIHNGEIIAAAQEERFTRIKNDEHFPTNAIQFCLAYAGVTINELEAIVFYEKPFLKFERLLDTYISYAPKGLLSFSKAIPIWLREKLFLKKIIKDELAKIEKYDKKKLKLLFSEHHLSHAASAYFPSPFVEAAILTIDGVGEWPTVSIAKAKGNSIISIKEIRFPHSIGLLYSAFTYYLGFKVNSGEYKLMGLAPYGDIHAEETQTFKELIINKLCKIYDDGSIFLEQKYFNYATGLKMVHEQKWEELFGFPIRKPEDNIEKFHCNLALAIQLVTENVVEKLAIETKRVTGCKNLCMAGGVALNCVANGNLQNISIFDNIYIQPAAGDAGGALGAALAIYHIYYKKDKIAPDFYDQMKGTYLGPDYCDKEIEYACRKYKMKFEHDSNEILYKKTATLLANGNIVGWFQGKMEFGPRALGNRSILGDPRNTEMQKKLNLNIKYREGFRPFAPSVLYEKAEQYFDLKTISPYMLFVQQIAASQKKNLPQNFSSFSLKEKLYTIKSVLPAITHVDFTARIQTVHKQTNESFWTLINEFEKITGCPILINTSFNVRGEPIVCSPEDAIKCFIGTAMDILVMNNYFLIKSDQDTTTSVMTQNLVLND